MKCYLAARYSRREELLKKKADLEAHGHLVTSRWLDGNHQASDLNLQSSEAKLFAKEDWDDLYHSNCCIAFTEEPRKPGNTRGGRHVEFGGAMAMGHMLIVIGHKENVFYFMDGVQFYPTWEAFMADIGRYMKEGVACGN